jgi:spore germination cell wall hydrolase CwlJ-like protein
MLNTALMCLALNIYHEARSEDIASQIAVAEVTLNRVASQDYPNTVCGVVKQKGQFSWYWDEKSDTPYEKKAFNGSIDIAKRMLSERDYYNVVGKEATHYHASYVKPYWAKKFKRIKTVGKHIFYKKEKK